MLLAAPWAVVACEDDSHTSVGGGGGEGGGDAGSNGGPKGGSKSTAGEPSTSQGGSEATAGEPSTGGMAAGGTADAGGNGGAAALCVGVECPYGEECQAGECESTCVRGRILCNGDCIDPALSSEFCGATSGCDNGQGPNPQGSPVGAGGAASEAMPSAGEHCAEGFSCQTGECQYSGLLPGSDVVRSRGGFGVQCTEWVGNVCVKPWIQIPQTAVVDPTPGNTCIDNDVVMRPIWHWSDGDAEARSFCWIATGSSEYRSVDPGALASAECGWMYGDFVTNVSPPVPDCTTFRRYSEVDSPGDLPNVVWSFDLITGEGCRNGNFSAIECYWPVIQ